MVQQGIGGVAGWLGGLLGVKRPGPRAVFNFGRQPFDLGEGRLRPGASPAHFEELEKRCQIVLPPLHREFLAATNGYDVYRGYERIYGLFRNEDMDAVRWNAPDVWKFVWGGRADAYWCFGGNAWGDQYAYDLKALAERSVETVFELNALTMEASPIADDFGTFVAEQILDPRAHRELPSTGQVQIGAGDIPTDSLIAAMPHETFEWPEERRSWELSAADSVMRINGEVAIQCEGRIGLKCRRMDPYQDEQGRPRLRLVFDDAS